MYIFIETCWKKLEKLRCATIVLSFICKFVFFYYNLEIFGENKNKKMSNQVCQSILWLHEKEFREWSLKSRI